MKNLTLIAAILAIFFLSCKKEEKHIEEKQIEEKIETHVIDKSAPAYNYIQSLGYPDSAIIDDGENFIVEGDIMFHKNSSYITDNLSNAKTLQYSSSNLVGYDVQPNIRVKLVFTTSYSQEVVEALPIAIFKWNNIPNLRVKFAATTSNDYNILISVDQAAGGGAGSSYYPMNGLPGAKISLNAAGIYGMSITQIASVLMHELGHAIGFRHTDWSGHENKDITDVNGAIVNAVNIMGTPTGADATSLFNRSPTVTTFSDFDIIAAQFLYPQNPRYPGTVPVFRYYDNNGWEDHYYSADYNVMGRGKNTGFIFEGIAFFAFSEPSGGRVPLYRYFHSGMRNHFYTIDFSSLGNGADGWTYEGITCYVYPTAINGSRPVYRYYKNANGDHFYTLNQNEFFTGAGGYVLEGIEFYAY